MVICLRDIETDRLENVEKRVHICDHFVHEFQISRYFIAPRLQAYNVGVLLAFFNKRRSARSLCDSLLCRSDNE